MKLRHSRSRGLTLIELLLVIGTIYVLGALCLRAYTRELPYPHSVYFCGSYAACLGVISVVALHCMRRFPRPVASLVLGLASLGATFWFALWLESGLMLGGQANYQLGLPYRHFFRGAFAGFVVFFAVRGGYLLRHVSSWNSRNSAS